MKLLGLLWTAGLEVSLGLEVLKRFPTCSDWIAREAALARESMAIVGRGPGKTMCCDASAGITVCFCPKNGSLAKLYRRHWQRFAG